MGSSRIADIPVCTDNVVVATCIRSGAFEGSALIRIGVCSFSRSLYHNDSFLNGACFQVTKEFGSVVTHTIATSIILSTQTVLLWLVLVSIAGMGVWIVTLLAIANYIVSAAIVGCWTHELSTDQSFGSAICIANVSNEDGKEYKVNGVHSQELIVLVWFCFFIHQVLNVYHFYTTFLNPLRLY